MTLDGDTPAPPSMSKKKKKKKQAEVKIRTISDKISVNMSLKSQKYDINIIEFE